MARTSMRKKTTFKVGRGRAHRMDVGEDYTKSNWLLLGHQNAGKAADLEDWLCPHHLQANSIWPVAFFLYFTQTINIATSEQEEHSSEQAKAERATFRRGRAIAKADSACVKKSGSLQGSPAHAEKRWSGQFTSRRLSSIVAHAQAHAGLTQQPSPWTYCSGPIPHRCCRSNSNPFRGGCPWSGPQRYRPRPDAVFFRPRRDPEGCGRRLDV